MNDIQSDSEKLSDGGGGCPFSKLKKESKRSQKFKNIKKNKDGLANSNLDKMTTPL